MRVRILDNVSEDLLSVLSGAMEQSTDIRVAVAFVSSRGLALIEPSMMVALEAGAPVEFLVGLDMRSTDPQAVQSLFEMSGRRANLALYCYVSAIPGAMYHPKLYLVRRDGEAMSIIGSSNLTEGGLSRNVEVNVVIEANMRDEIISDAYGTYNTLKFHPKRVVPDHEFLALYSRLCEEDRQQRHRSARDRSLRKLMNDFEEKAASLQRPTPTSRDLIGWLELVYDSLPDGEFANQDIYQYEREFKRNYPENLNIRAKIRQQLQALRDMGLVEHLARARWRKV